MKLNRTQYAVLGVVAVALVVVVAALLTRPGGAPALNSGDDAVNRIAAKLYCPVCENIPLDVCGTAACIQWREEIGLQLAAGKNETQIINDFVTRFGDRVVGIPQDLGLRTLTLIAPVVASLAALLTAVFVFVRWRIELTRQGSQQPISINAAPTSAYKPQDLQEYRTRLERDLARRR